MKKDFDPIRETIMRPQSQMALRPEQQRQRTGNQQQIVELIVEQPRVEVQLQPPTIERVEDGTREEERIAPVAESIHRSAVKTRPKPTARAIFKMTSTDLG